MLGPGLPLGAAGVGVIGVVETLGPPAAPVAVLEGPAVPLVAAGPAPLPAAFVMTSRWAGDSDSSPPEQPTDMQSPKSPAAQFHVKCFMRLFPASTFLKLSRL